MSSGGERVSQGWLRQDLLIPRTKITSEGEYVFELGRREHPGLEATKKALQNGKMPNSPVENYNVIEVDFKNSGPQEVYVAKPAATGD